MPGIRSLGEIGDGIFLYSNRESLSTRLLSPLHVTIFRSLFVRMFS
jgi:hypothetical protein